MLTTLRTFAWIGILSCAFALNGQQAAGTQKSASPPVPADCFGPPVLEARPDVLARPNATSSAWGCVPPYDMPVYTPPPDDSAVFGSLLEAAGYTVTAKASWLGAAAGSFCGGPEKQMVLMQNRAPFFSIMDGPTPHQRRRGGTVSLLSNTSHPWRAVAAGNLDGGPEDEIVAVRQVTAAGVPDLVVAKISTCSCSILDEVSGNCGIPTVIASTAIGNPSNSDWVGAAVGNFDGNGKQIALLKRRHSNLFLVKLRQQNSQSSLQVSYSDDLDLAGTTPSSWKALAAGDIDHDGMDELIAVRQVNDGRSPTVLAYKWDRANAKFRLYATSAFGNNGNSNWTAAAVGDFNADGRQAIVLVKNRHSNFVVLDLVPGATQLRTLATHDLDSKSGQNWTGLAATDWLHGDQSAAELIAVRAVNGGFRTSLFVYGNPFQRAARDSGLEGTKSQWANTGSIEDLKTWLRGTHTNAFFWLLNGPGDYRNLLEFLFATKDWGVDGKQLRVWVTLVPPRYVTAVNGAPDGDCSQPEASSRSSFDPFEFFQDDLRHVPAITAEGTIANVDDRIAACKDMLGWASLIGRLAKDYPHLVGLAIDDFSEQFDQPFTPDTIAQIEARMRARSPWLNFAPLVYYPLRNDSRWKDVGLTLDSMVYFFRNEKKKQPCMIGNTAECERTVDRAPGEIAEMIPLLPAGRKMLLGIYFVGLWSEGPPNAGKAPTPRYDYDLARLGLNLPSLGGAMAYGLECPGAPLLDGSFANCSDPNYHLTCTDFNFLDHRYCALRQAYGGKPQHVTHSDLIPNGPSAAGDPVAYFVSADGTHHVIYRSGNNHLQELWWTTGPVGRGDITPNGPTARGDPAAYFIAADGTQHVIYRGGNGHLHELWWGTGPVGQGDLTPNGPTAASNPAAYFVAADGTQHVIYRGGNGHLHELWWTTGPVGQGDLTPNGGAAVGDPSAYFVAGDGTHHVIYRRNNGHLYELWWTTGPVGQGDLTPNGPAAAGNPSASFATAEGTNHVIYRGSNGHLHELWWSGAGAVGHGDLTALSNTPPAQSDPSVYYAAADGTNHVIYRGAAGRVHELVWTRGVVTHNDLTALAAAVPDAVGDPAAYFATDGTHHVIYRSSDGHLHELKWSN